MRRVYLFAAGLLLFAVVAQFYLAAVGAFAKPQTDESFALPDLNGMMVIPLVSLLATGAAALAKAPGRLIGLTILPLGLVVVQVLIVLIGQSVSGGADRTTPAGLTIMGLHALNGLAIGAVAGMVFRGARLLLSSPTAVAPAA